MNYLQLAKEFVKISHQFKQIDKQKHFEETMRGEMLVIFCVLHQQNNITPSIISRKMNISSARVAVILNNLETKGLISRTKDTKDRRQIIVSLTSAGEKIAEETKSEILNNVKNMLKKLGEKDALELIRIMKKLTEII